MAKVYGYNGTLSGSPVNINVHADGGFIAQEVMILNAHASNDYTFTYSGIALNCPANSWVTLPVTVKSATINGTGGYTVLYSDKAGVLAANRYSTQTISAGQVDTAELAADAVTGAKVGDDEIDSEHFAAGSIDAEHLAANILTSAAVAEVAAEAVTGAMPVLYHVSTAGGANGNESIAITRKTRVANAWVVLKAGGGTTNTITVRNGTTAITDALDISSMGDKAMSPFEELDDAQMDVADGANLNVIWSSASSDAAACEVYVLGYLVS